MTTTHDDTTAEARFTEGFEDFLASRRSEPAWLTARRRAAMARFEALGLPTPAHEDWKYTAIGPITKLAFERRTEPALVAKDVIERFCYWETSLARIVFVDGHYSAEYSEVRTLPEGVCVSSLSALMASPPDWLEAHLAADAASETCPFRSLSTAWAQDGAVIRMPKGQKLDGPIHVLNLGTPGKSPASTSLRHLVIAEPNSEISVVERYAGIDESATYFTNSAIDVHIGRNASVHHYKVQRESEASLHLGSMRVHQDAAARFRSVCISAGGALARHDIETRQLGEGTETDLSGLALVDGRRHADFRVLVHHSRSHGTSKQFYKSILDNESTAVFNGRIVADHGTVGTDAQQTNNNLLLTDGAVANTRPQLEIYADDIACSHGATVGQLDADAMFYLQSRGLPKRRAESLLTYAFASDIVDRVTIEPIRHRIHEYLATRMECGDELGEDS